MMNMSGYSIIRALYPFIIYYNANPAESKYVFADSYVKFSGRIGTILGKIEYNPQTEPNTAVKKEKTVIAFKRKTVFHTIIQA